MKLSFAFIKFDGRSSPSLLLFDIVILRRNYHPPTYHFVKCYLGGDEGGETLSVATIFSSHQAKSFIRCLELPVLFLRLLIQQILLTYISAKSLNSLHHSYIYLCCIAGSRARYYCSYIWSSNRVANPGNPNSIRK